MPRTPDRFRRAQAAVGAQFLLLGFQYASWASRLPAIKAGLGLTDAEVGTLLMGCGIGAATSFPLVAALIKRFGSAAVCAGAAVPLALVPLALGAAPDYPLALAVACADGVALACLDVAMNAQGAQLEEQFGRKTIGRLHATFSAGALLGALTASAVTAATANLTVHFAIAAALMLALAGSARASLLPRTEPQPQPEPVPRPVPGPEPAPAVPTDLSAASATSAPDEGAHRSRIKTILPAGKTLWIGAAIAFATIVEGAMNDWSALYLKNVAKAAPSLTPIGIAVFSVAMVLARILSDSWRKRWGDARVVVLGSSLACASLAIAVLAGGSAPALAGFALVGLGIAAVAPCIYVAAAGIGTDALALTSAMGTVGLLVGPGAIGLIAETHGLAWAMGAVSIAAAAVALAGARVLTSAPNPRSDAAGRRRVRTTPPEPESEVEGLLPPILVERGTLRVIDGTHRLLAAFRNGRATIEARFFDGPPSEVFLHAVKANVAHGYPLSLPDRRAAADRILASHPHLSDRAIAEIAGLGAKTVAAIRRDSPGALAQPSARVGRDGRVRPVDGAEGRRRVVELINRHPDSSLRMIARWAGVSPATAIDVRKRLESGEQAESRPDTRVGDAVEPRLPARAIPAQPVRPSGLPADPQTVLEKLLRDPCLRYKDAGRQLLALLRQNALSFQGWAELSGSCRRIASTSSSRSRRSTRNSGPISRCRWSNSM